MKEGKTEERKKEILQYHKGIKRTDSITNKEISHNIIEKKIHVKIRRKKPINV